MLRSLTKLYTLPGLRLGYAVTSPALARQIREQSVPWSVNALAQAAGLAALEDEVFLAETQTWLGRSERTSVSASTWLRCRRCSPCRLGPTSCSCAWRACNRHGWRRALAGRGIVIRDAANFIGLGPHYVRLAVRTPEDNDRLVAELRSILVQGC